MEKLMSCLLLALLLTACAVPERRHTAAQLQAYRVQDFAWPPAAAKAEAAMLAREHARLVANLAQPETLAQAMAAVMLFNMEIEAARAPLLAALPDLAAQPVERQRALLTAAYTLYPREAGPSMATLLPQLATPREFAIAAYTLLKSDAGTAPMIARLMRRRADCCDEPRLAALAEALAPGAAAEPPALAELLAAPLQPGLPVVFSLHHAGRDGMGLALVRGADGRFVRDAEGQVLMLPQLARSRSGLPGTLSNGNTPRGLFSVRGAGTAGNPWIGPTPYLHSMLPVEASVAEFLHEPEAGRPWTEATYAALLPPAWRPSLREAWLAGQAGRSEILMHGTTLNPVYYRDAPYFPGTPSAGCLVAPEQWSREDGRLLASDQLRLAQAFSAGGLDRGFLIVADLPGEGPVDRGELLDAVLSAERLPATGR